MNHISTKYLFDNKEDLPQEYRFFQYRNGNTFLVMYDPDCMAKSYCKITYNTGDVVYKHNDTVICIKTHDGIRYGDMHPAITVLDSFVVIKPTLEAARYAQRQAVVKNLQKNPHHYDKLIAHFKGSGNEEPIKPGEAERFFNL